MVGQELEPCRLDVGLELVKLDAVAVVDEDILVLGYSKMRMVLQEPGAWVTADSINHEEKYERNVPACFS